MRILVVGGGGREHALAWKIWASPLCDALFAAPGNAGIAEIATCAPVGAEDVEGIVKLASLEKIDFVVIGPEAPLAAGLADRLEAHGIKAFGPGAKAARLESSKMFMKEICRKYGIPAAEGGRFEELADAKRYIAARDRAMVVKADGLAAGKGVIVAETVEETLRAAEELMNKYGPVVVEEKLDGEEASCFALVDGHHVLKLASAQDHKRVGEGDTGPNTGGMGAYSPAPVMSEALEERVMDEIIRPAAAAMEYEGAPFKGVLYAGVMITEAGPKLLEFNVRFGDPECQVLMARLKSDLLPALLAARDGVLDNFDLRWSDDAAVCVVMAAKGYPGDYRKGTMIQNLEDAGKVPGVTVFHAGTKKADGAIVADGGRVLGVTATAPSLAQAQQRAYDAAKTIDWPDGYYRRDIGWRALKEK